MEKHKRSWSMAKVSIGGLLTDWHCTLSRQSYRVPTQDDILL